MFWDQESSGDSIDHWHPSHVMHYSNETWYDKFCINCGETNQVPGKLAACCLKEPEQHRMARLLDASTEFINSTIGNT
jgi:hypothetical protein